MYSKQCRHAGAVLRALRQSRSWTLEEFSRKVKIFDAGRLSKIETGKLPLTANTVADIEAYADFTVDEMRMLWHQAMTDHLRRHFGNRSHDFLADESSSFETGSDAP